MSDSWQDDDPEQPDDTFDIRQWEMRVLKMVSAAVALAGTVVALIAASVFLTDDRTVATGVCQTPCESPAAPPDPLDALPVTFSSGSTMSRR